MSKHGNELRVRRALERLGVFRLLVTGAPGLAAGEIAAALELPPSSLSFHLAALENAGLVIATRTGRFIHYRVEPEAIRDLLGLPDRGLLRGPPGTVRRRAAHCGCYAAPPVARQPKAPLRKQEKSHSMNEQRIYRVLFLCTANSARSVLAEAALQRAGAGRFEAYSAGSTPRGQVNPAALELLAAEGFDISQLRSKSWDEFAAPGAPELDFIITLCDSAAGEDLPGVARQARQRALGPARSRVGRRRSRAPRGVRRDPARDRGAHCAAAATADRRAGRPPS
jgi:ArsR family transcriptional regulator, arsenate/arsenite/antimonite-responsive transcriptional repressor / arsenate reductase (thioredoxin)